jgi:hypothetical protein
MKTSTQVRACLILVALLSWPKVQDSANSMFGGWRRLSESPVISPRGNGWESAGTLNPSGIARDGKFIMLYRAQDKAGTSR